VRGRGSRAGNKRRVTALVTEAIRIGGRGHGHGEYGVETFRGTASLSAKIVQNCNSAAESEDQHLGGTAIIFRLLPSNRRLGI
jgi:hypothetical protein